MLLEIFRILLSEPNPLGGGKSLKSTPSGTGAGSCVQKQRIQKGKWAKSSKLLQQLQKTVMKGTNDYD
ncbi:hypothetical protein CYJ68_07050 [Gardnerella vaginalis]|nr:hypothetical protein CYJ68_07050 [Gardnerella vaginalis]